MKKKAKLNAILVRQTSKVLRSIAHPDRLRIVEYLEQKEKSVGEITKALRLTQAVISKHLAVLRRDGIVANSVQANYRYYSITHPGVIHILNCMRKYGGTS